MYNTASEFIELEKNYSMKNKILFINKDNFPYE